MVQITDNLMKKRLRQVIFLGCPQVVVRVSSGAYFVAHIFKYLAPNFAPRRPA